VIVLLTFLEVEMSAPATAAPVLRFDVFELDNRAGELRKNGVKLRLRGQPLQVLTILLERSGNVVTREELRAQLWPADTFVDFDHSLHNSIARLREVLGDSAETPRYIETLPRRGYRFITPVEEVQAPVISPESSKKTGEPPQVAIPTRQRRGLILTLLLCGAVSLAGLLMWRHFAAHSVAPPIRSIAVLPLQNLSGDASQEYFADGMTEELITELSRIHALKVISRTSVMEYKGTRKHLPQIARELGVDGILEGSVIREGDQMRITVQLLDAPNDRHLWSEDYQRPLRGILSLQREIAQAIAQQIRLQLTPQQEASIRTARAVNPQAYESYLRGRFYLNTQYTTSQGLNAATSYFEEAIRKDPNLALAYAGLADVYLNMAFYRHLSPERAYRSAKEAVHKALELDDSLGEAHTVLALLSWQYEWDLPSAEREFTQAIALAPSYDCLRAYHSGYRAWSGRRAEALAETTKARELNPGSSFAISESDIYFQLRDYAGLVEASRRGVASDPNEWLEHYFLGIGYEGTGKRADAIPEYQMAVKMSGGDQDATAMLAHAYATIGRRAEAEKILRDFKPKLKDDYVSPYMIATIYAGLGDKDRAFEFLEKAYQQRCLDIPWHMRSDPRIDNLRSDPRFQNLVRRVGLTN
jgi:TolB-like protein/DNA-binding winged helix-turn-helix (wHTH) protein/Flp pilus assembly protein TadD